MKYMLEGKTVLVVGGGSGIGLAVAKLAHGNGARVLIASRNARKQVNVSDGAMERHSLDISSEEDIGRLFTETGSVDHLVVTVRPDLKATPFPETDVEEARRAFDVKFWGSYRLIQAALPHMRQDGSIILTSGIAGEKIYKGASVMAVINSAVETLCRALAMELAPLRVNVVSPGFVEPKPAEVQEYAGRFPAGRLASVNDVAMAYLHLMISPYVTGAVTVVDGGARLI